MEEGYQFLLVDWIWSRCKCLKGKVGLCTKCKILPPVAITTVTTIAITSLTVSSSSLFHIPTPSLRTLETTHLYRQWTVRHLLTQPQRHNRCRHNDRKLMTTCVRMHTSTGLRPRQPRTDGLTMTTYVRMHTLKDLGPRQPRTDELAGPPPSSPLRQQKPVQT